MKTRLLALIPILTLGLSSLALSADDVPPKPYPLDVCIVSGNDLGSMGEETEMVYEGQVIKFCCKPCEKKFLKNPAKYLKKLEPKTEAAEKIPGSVTGS
jgi:YHS domain-containing protein